MSDNQIDWRRMFLQYSHIVALHEGVDFLKDRDWTPEEWGAIEAVQATDEYGDYRAVLRWSAEA